MSKLVLESYNGYNPYKHNCLKEDKDMDDEWVKFVKEMDKTSINERLEKIENEIAEINKSIKIILLMMEHPKTWPDYLEISEKMNSIQKKMSDIKAQQIWDAFKKEHNL